MNSLSIFKVLLRHLAPDPEVLEASAMHALAAHRMAIAKDNLLRTTQQEWSRYQEQRAGRTERLQWQVVTQDHPHLGRVHYVRDPQGMQSSVFTHDWDEAHRWRDTQEQLRTYWDPKKNYAQVFPEPTAPRGYE